MKSMQNSTRWLGLALACGTLTFVMSAEAGKPVKPPSTPAFTPVSLGGLISSDGLILNRASAINNAGQVVGYTGVPGYPNGYHQAYLLNPRDTNGDGNPDTWFVDAVQNATGLPGPDGQNDLIIGLGNLPACTQGYAMAINDLGLVVGRSSASQMFIVVPEDGLWYQDVNSDGINDLMRSLGALPGRAGWTLSSITLNNLGQVTGWSYDPNNSSLRGGFLLTPVQVAPGVWEWFQDDGTGANALMVDLGAFFPNGINDSGQIVGALAGRATLRQPDGTLVDLRAGGIQNDAEVINNRGQIGLGIAPDNDGWHTALLTPVDTNNDGAPDLWYRDLNGDGVNDLVVHQATLSNETGSMIAVHGLNEGASVVGRSVMWTGNPPRGTWKSVAVLWENGGVSKLKDLTGGQIEFLEATAINNARQILSDACILLPTR